MARRVLIRRTDGTAADLVEKPAPSEEHLRDVLQEHPSLLPLDDFALDGPLLVIGPATSRATGRNDLLCLAMSGDVILVEFRTGAQTPDLRAALAELIDCGADLWQLSLVDFDHGVVRRHLADRPYAHRPEQLRVIRHRGSHRSDDGSRGDSPHVTTLDEVAVAHWQLSETGLDVFLNRLEQVLTTGDFHFVVTAERFSDSIATAIDYLNTASRLGSYYFLQLTMLEGSDATTYVAETRAGPPRT